MDYETAQGASNARGLATGALFTLTGYPRQDQNREYLILSAKYKLQSDAFGSSSALGTTDIGQAPLPSSTVHSPPSTPRRPFVPHGITPKARVQGPQTVLVVGPAGQEIWTDQYGRVKVQFHWDRYG